MFIWGRNMYIIYTFKAYAGLQWKIIMYPDHTADADLRNFFTIGEAAWSTSGVWGEGGREEGGDPRKSPSTTIFRLIEFFD